MVNITLKDIKCLKLTPEYAKLLQSAINTVDLDNDKEINRVLKTANQLLNGYGVEGLRDERAWVDHYYQDFIALYVNLGETYTPTVVFDTENRKFYVTSWGDFYEGWEIEFSENNYPYIDSNGNDTSVVDRIKTIHNEIKSALRDLDYDIENEKQVSYLEVGQDEVEVTYKNNEGYEVRIQIQMSSPHTW